MHRVWIELMTQVLSCIGKSFPFAGENHSSQYNTCQQPDARQLDYSPPSAWGPAAKGHSIARLTRQNVTIGSHKAHNY